MAIYELLSVFWICIISCMFTEGADYYISTSITTWNNVPEDCRLAQPEYDHKYETGQIILRRNIILNATLKHDVWIGYFKALTKFEYHGCAMLSTAAFLNVTSLVDCHYACNGTYFGLDCSSKELKCTCMDTLPDYTLLKSLCVARGDFVCGEGNRQAIYSFGNDITSREQDRTTTANMCMASASHFYKSAWVKCEDKNNKRRAWCLNGIEILSDDIKAQRIQYRFPVVSDGTFAAWNTANDYCASRSSLPSTAVGYNGDTFEDMAFTKIFRNWTLQQGSGSVSGGPMMFAYVRPNSTEIMFSVIPTESKNFLCLGPNPTRSSTTAVAAGVSVTVAIAISAVVIVLVLRKRKKFCFANTKRSNLDNRADDNHISLQNDLYQAPGAPVLSHTFSGLDIGNIKSKEHEASPFTDVTYQDTYQDIDTDDTYAGIDDSREDNNDYDYTNKGFKDSITEISDNVYNHLNAAGNEYDHVGKGQSNVKALENNYDVTSSAIRK